VIFEAFTTVKTQVEVFWVVTNVSEDHTAILQMETAWFSETLVSYSRTAWRHSTEDHDLKLQF
jgi:hypothetical protein